MLALAKHIMLLVCAFANIFKLLKNDLTHQAPWALLAHQLFFKHSILPNNYPVERQGDCRLNEHSNKITGNSICTNIREATVIQHI